MQRIIFESGQKMGVQMDRGLLLGNQIIPIAQGHICQQQQEKQIIFYGLVWRELFVAL